MFRVFRGSLSGQPACGYNKFITRLKSRPWAVALALAAVIVIAAILRAYRLDAQSFWYDEGNSARIAERSLQLIIEGAAGDIHPPLYYIVLHYWRAVFGESEAALRGLSVVCGVGLVGFAYLIGKALFSARTGVIAAVLVAASPFAVYYSQEARMYGLLALEAAVSTWALLQIVDFGLTIDDSRNQSSIVNLKSTILLFVLATAAGLYTHYAYPFVMIAQGVCVVIWLAAQMAAKPRPALRPVWVTLALYAGMNVAAIVLFLPWLPTALHQITSWTVTPQDYPLGPALLDGYRWIAVGRTLPLAEATLPMLVLGALALIGLWPFRDDSHTSAGRSVSWLPALWMLLMAVLPFALLFALKLYRESYLKFLLVAVAPLSVLAARGIAGLSTAWLRGETSRAARLVSIAVATGLTGVMVATLWPSLNNLYNNPAYARDDYRGIARLVQSGAMPGDAVLFNAPNQWEVFTYYHRPERELAPAIALTYHPADDAAVDAQMRPIAQQHRRLFVLYYGERESDPDGRYERWLATNTFKADEQWVGNIRLAVYATQLLSATPVVTATFGDVIHLDSARVELEPKPAGGLISLELDWRAPTKLDARYKVFVHVGLPDAAPVAQNDAEPVGGLRPTNTWNADEAVIDRRAVWLKPGTPPGRYSILVGLYDSATGQRLPVVSADGTPIGDRLKLGEIEVR